MSFFPSQRDERVFSSLFLWGENVFFTYDRRVNPVETALFPWFFFPVGGITESLFPCGTEELPPPLTSTKNFLSPAPDPRANRLDPLMVFSPPRRFFFEVPVATPLLERTCAFFLSRVRRGRLFRHPLFLCLLLLSSSRSYSPLRAVFCAVSLSFFSSRSCPRLSFYRFSALHLPSQRRAVVFLPSQRSRPPFARANGPRFLFFFLPPAGCLVLPPVLSVFTGEGLFFLREKGFSFSGALQEKSVPPLSRRWLSVRFSLFFSKRLISFLLSSPVFESSSLL